MHHVVRAQRASWRQGTHNTLTRGQVRGGGRKPFRQKGTGRARQGTIRAPHYTGGGVVFGPHPRNYSFRVNNKEVKLAMRSALSAKLAEGALTLSASGRVATPELSVERIEELAALRALIEPELASRAGAANTYDLIDNKALVLTEAALKYIEEVLA